MRKVKLIVFLCLIIGQLSLYSQVIIEKVAITDHEVIAESTPAPLYRDPVYDGAADPVLVWNPQREVWWMFYTQRRAKMDEPGVEWCHETEIGVAESVDDGFTWTYIGILELSHPDEAYSWWAPDVILDENGIYHLFPTYVPGAAETHTNWGGERYIFHYTSTDLWNWKFKQKLTLTSEYCIDASLFKTPEGNWRLWYKDEGHRSQTFAVESPDLELWYPVDDPGVSKLYGEAPKIFRFKDYYWLLKDPDSGLDVYRSEDLENWNYQGKILDKPGTRNSDGAIGKHPDVVVCEDYAFIVYFTHPFDRQLPSVDGIYPFSNRHTSLQAAELQVKNGVLICDRDNPFRISLCYPNNISSEE